MTRRVLTPEELQIRAAELAAQPPAENEVRKLEEGFLIMILGGEAYGLAAPMVQEVVCRPSVTPLPVNPRFVAGVMNLRGEVVAVLDLAAMFGLAASRRRPYAVVVRHEELTAAILADEILEVEWFAASTRQPVVATVRAEVAALFTGVFHWRGKLVTGIDLPGVLGHEEFLRLRKPQEAAGP
ncbi:MAG: purine-binding chemotaxis protein CheW [Elusimicrobia bacterium]|nr:purine-binding chemotaxis protein CheW [Elusimicrobiota bacterium]